LIDLLTDYFLFAIPLRNSITGKKMCSQNVPTNRPKTKTFQITVPQL